MEKRRKDALAAALPNFKEIVQQPNAIYLAIPVHLIIFFLWIAYLLDVYNKIQMGVELLPLGNSRNSR